MNPLHLLVLLVSLPLLLGVCEEKTSKPEAKANPPSTSPAQEANNNQPKTDPTPKLEKENVEPPKAEPKVEAKNPEPTKTAATKLIANPIVEKAIRKQIKKPTGELTKVDLEKVIQESDETSYGQGQKRGIPWIIGETQHYRGYRG